jgi:hypothetical protein
MIKSAKEAKRSIRNAGDRERDLYVGVRKVLAPRTTLVRTRAARRSTGEAPFEIPGELGYARFQPGRFPEAGEVAAAARELRASADLEKAASKTKKTFMIPLLDAASLDRESPFLRLALREDVLSAVAAYLGVAPILSNINTYLSQPATGEKWSSQLFHCDGDDTRQIKLFVLASEVDMDNGPLMIMDAESSRSLRDKIGYQYRARVTDDEAREAIGDVTLEPVVGPPGTTCFVDTSRCFHFGSRVGAQSEPRLATILQFSTPYSFMLPRKPQEAAPFNHLVRDGDSELQRLALGA